MLLFVSVIRLGCVIQVRIKWIPSWWHRCCCCWWGNIKVFDPRLFFQSVAHATNTYRKVWWKEYPKPSLSSSLPRRFVFIVCVFSLVGVFFCLVGRGDRRSDGQEVCTYFLIRLKWEKKADMEKNVHQSKNIYWKKVWKLKTRETERNGLKCGNARKMEKNNTWHVARVSGCAG